MSEDLQQLLLNLKLKAIAARLDEIPAAAEQAGTPLKTLLAQLLRAEWEARQQAALAARLRRAHMPELLTLESFPFKVQTGAPKAQIQELASLSFIERAENIVLLGPSEHAS
jgi:DNA replication protein DnaC